MICRSKLGIVISLEEYQVSARPHSISRSLFIKISEQTYEGHAHYIMYLAYNPKGANTFLSACLKPHSQNVVLWFIHYPIFQWKHTKKGVSLYLAEDKPYPVTTGEDKTPK